MIGIVGSILLLRYDKGLFKRNVNNYTIDLKKDKERYRAFFYERHKNQYPDQRSLVEAFEASWKRMCEL